MTQLVTDERGQQHEFPDEATPQMILQALGRAPRTPTASAAAHATVNDYLTQTLHGLGRGVAAIPGIAGDIPTLAGRGLEWLGGKVAPETTAALAGAVRPVTSLLTPPTSAETVGFAERNLIGARPQPASAGARVAGDIAQFVPASLIPMGGPTTATNIARQGLLGALSGAASVGAREAGLPPGAQIAAGLAPGLLSSAGGALSGRTGAAGYVRRATSELAPEDWQRAQQLQTTARATGVPLMGQEALAPTVGAGPLGALASDVAATSAGAPIINRVVQQRPGQITEAVKAATAKLGPAASADEVLTSVKSTAQRAIEAAQRERTRVTSPLFQAAGKADIPAPAVQPVIDSIDSALTEAGAGTKLGSALTKLRGQLVEIPKDASLPARIETRVARLQNIYQELRDSLDDPLMLEGSLRKQAGILRPIAGQLQQTLVDNNIIYRQANDLYSRMSGPVRALTGDPDNPALMARVAGAKSNEALRRLLLDPENVSPKNIASVANVFRSQGRLPDLGAFMRHAMENEFNQSARQLQSGANPAMGAKFGNAVYGTEKQRALMTEYWNQIDPTGAAGRGMETLFRVTDRTARTPGMGSQTAARLQMGEGLGGGPASTVAQVGAGAVLAATGIPAGQLAGGYLVSQGILGQIRRAYLNLGAAKIARALTAPDAVGKLRSLARKDPASPAAATGVLAILGGRATAEPSKD